MGVRYTVSDIRPSNDRWR